jgi:hypothetical protein
MTGKDKKPAKLVKPWDAKLSHKVIHTIATVVITLALIGGGAYAYLSFKRDTQAVMKNNPGKAITSTIAASDTPNAHFDETSFAFDLPGDWKRLQPDLNGLYKKYSYQAGQKNADNRWLDVYADGLPLEMPVNKAVAVRSEGSHLSHGMVSDNCSEFTPQSTPKKLKVTAKWDGVDFLCDMDAVTRNVVGTSAPGSVNKVELTNAGTKHTFFFVYTDNNYNPEYGIFYRMLDSFTVK